MSRFRRPCRGVLAAGPLTHGGLADGGYVLVVRCSHCAREARIEAAAILGGFRGARCVYRRTSPRWLPRMLSCRFCGARPARIRFAFAPPPAGPRCE